MFICFIYTALFIQVSQIRSAKILAIVSTPSYSHQVAFYPLWKELTNRGHQVTLLTTDPLNDPALSNLTEIDLRFTYSIVESYNFSDIINVAGKSPLEFVPRVAKMFHSVIDAELSHPRVKELIQNREINFDVAMIEVFLPTMIAFGHRFNCPVIGLMSMDAHALIHEFVGNPVHPVLYPDNTIPFVGKFSFIERVFSTIISFGMKIILYSYVIPKEDLTIKKHFSEDYPDIVDLLKNMSLLFIAGDTIFQKVRPVGPSTINIGGGRRGVGLTPKKLPQDLQTFLDSAKEGVIYFSLGSNVKSKDIAEETRRVIMETFADLPYSVLWKFEADDLKGKAKNVRLMKWVPQQDVLRHPNVKLFITQGGLQSTEEAIFSHVPMVGMPFFGDQIGNVKKMVLRGLGLQVDHITLDENTFKEVILEVIENPKYKENVKKIAELIQDEPMTGLERAVWWTEYVIRHKGAKHLRSPAIDMPAYQYLLLDVIGFLLLVLAVSLYVIVKIFKIILRLISTPFVSEKKTN